MRLDIYTLGFFRVLQNGVVIPDLAWKTQKNRSLLKILLTHRGHPVTKEQLLEWLWHDLQPAAGARNLRVAVSQLRQILEPHAPRNSRSNFILTTDSGYTWNIQADYWLDAEEFEKLADNPQMIGASQHVECASFEQMRQEPKLSERMVAALDLYQGDYLEEDRYTEWATVERERLRELYLVLLTRLAEGHAQQGRYRRAVALCQRILAADPCREQIWRQLMCYHYYAGDRARSLRTYTDCRRILADELGVLPMPETENLAEQIRRNQVVTASGYPAPAVVERFQQSSPGRLGAPLHNLPQPFTEFVGRKAELAEISRCLATPVCRLLTLVGPGGIGKSRLAQQAAAALAANFSQGVFYVSMASTNTPDLTVFTIGESLQFKFHSQEAADVQLINYMRDREILLVLDNFEHLRAGAQFLLVMLRQAPLLKILVTSRERLNLYGERVFNVGGLAIPASDRNGRGLRQQAEIEQYSAVQLFLQSAGRMSPGFSLVGEDTAAVARICRLVGGMPLAIELAAGWVRNYSLLQIAKEIQRNLDFLVTPLQGVPERQQSLRSVFEHSWRLLTDEQREVLPRLSIFRSGFTRSAAESVAGASLSALTELMDKSLLYGEAAGRYFLHELTRQFAEEKLQDNPEKAEQMCTRHSAYYLAFIEQQTGALKSDRQLEAMRRLDGEIDNIRGAWQWALERQDICIIASAIEGLYMYYDLRSLILEGRQVFGQAAVALRRLLEASKSSATAHLSSRCAKETTLALGKTLTREAMCLFRLQQVAPAKARVTEGLSLLRLYAEPQEIAYSLYVLGYITMILHEYTASIEHLRESRRILTEVGDRWLMARVLNTFGYLQMMQGHYDNARQLQDQGLEIATEIGDRRAEAHLLDYLGRTYYGLGAYQQAKQYHTESLTIFRELDVQWGMAEALLYGAECAYVLGEYGEARRLGEESYAIFEIVGIPWGIADARRLLESVARLA